MIYYHIGAAESRSDPKWIEINCTVTDQLKNGSNKFNNGESAEPPLSKEPPVSTPKIETRLAKRATCNFRDVPLKRALDDLRTLSGLNFVLDLDALREANISTDQPVTISVENICLRSLLDLLLKQAHLTYVVKDEVVVVTTPQCARGKLRQVTYPVADLVVPVGAPWDSKPDEKAQPRATLEARLIELICTTIAADTWMDKGGPGTMQYFPLGMALVINQTQDVHEQIQELLQALRRLQDIEVAVEVRLVQISDSMFEKIHSLKQGVRGDWNSGLLLKEPELKAMLATLQTSRRTSIMQAPKITLFNGQAAPVDLTQKKMYVSAVEPAGGPAPGVQKETLACGWKYRLCPVVSADRRTVRVKLELKRTDAEVVASASAPIRSMPAEETTYLLAPISATAATPYSTSAKVELARLQSLSLEQSLSIPDGMTAVLYVGESVGKHHETSRRREIQHHLVLVTPRIIINKQEETLVPTTGCP
jgi:hypothetical protein